MTDNRNAYIEKTTENLDLLKAKIRKLEALANKKTGEARRDLRERLDDIRETREKAEERLKELRSATSPAWDDIKQGFEDAWQSLSTAVDNATDRFQ